MTNRFPPLRPPVLPTRKPTLRTDARLSLAAPDLWLLAALVLSLGVALV